jgi:hypothetical protein
LYRLKDSIFYISAEENIVAEQTKVTIKGPFRGMQAKISDDEDREEDNDENDDQVRCVFLKFVWLCNSCWILFFFFKDQASCEIVDDTSTPSNADADKLQEMTNQEMKEFESAFQSMDKTAKWVLSTGTVVEDELYRFGRRCDFEQ